MKIWIFNNYNMQPQHGQLNRHYYFARYLTRKGHEPIVFAGSHPHNTELQLISGRERFSVNDDNGFLWINVKTINYEGSKLKQIFSMFQYYFNAKYASVSHEKPDVIIGSTAHPLAAVLAIRMAKKYHVQSIVEVRDLWPESIVEYGILSKKNPIVYAMRCLEKWIYIKADKVAFLDEGDYDYIIEQGWQNEIKRSKVYYLSNGVDLELFEKNKQQFVVKDKDLDDSEKFNVVYTGSIRKVNNIGLLLEVAKKVKNPRIQFLIWGKGDELESLKEKIRDEKIRNVVFKGYIEKKYIPYITSKADVNIVHNNPMKLFRFGISFNKIFDYLAAGKPIISDFPCKYNPVIQYGAGLDVIVAEPNEIAKVVELFSSMNKEKYNLFCDNAKKAAVVFSYDQLSTHLLDIINGTASNI